MPRLGVGVVDAPALRALLEREPHCVDVIELEPPEPRARLRGDADPLRDLAALPCAKVVHAGASPIGGSRGPKLRQLARLGRAARELDAPWASVGLAFDRAGDPGQRFATGCPLPPRQTPAGVAAAAGAAHAAQAALGRPLLIETGRSTLRPRADELPDGAFLRAVAEEADCGILLDLGNVLANARAGRQPAAELLCDLPLERVVEVRVRAGRAGSDEELALARAAIPRLCALRALVLAVESPSIDALGRELDALRALWRDAPAGEPAPRVSRPRPSSLLDADGLDDVRAWENALGALVARRAASGPLADDLARDPGLAALRGRADELRAERIATALPLTLRLLLLTVGPDVVRALLERHGARALPEPCAASEGEAFGAFLDALALDGVPWLADVLGYERGCLRAAATGRSVVVAFAHEPRATLRALRAGRLPAGAAAGRYAVAINA